MTVDRRDDRGAFDTLSATWPDDSCPSSRVFGVIERPGDRDTDGDADTDSQTLAIPGETAFDPDIGLDQDTDEDPLRQTVTRGELALDDPEPWRPLSERVRLASHKRVPGTRYEIVRWLGEGGMGAVFEAVHVDIRRPVALKILKPGVLAEGQQRERFLAEARAIAKVDSRFVVEVLDFGELSDGRPFYAMELLQSKSLHSELSEHGTLPLARALAILRQCCKALGAIHEQGMAHRDGKPENVLLQRDQGRDDTVRVVDFGIAAAFGSRPRVAGTIMYMAPEQIRDADFDGRVDIYALGCVAFEMLTGKPPYEGRSVMDVANAHLQRQPPRASDRRPDLPAGIDAILKRCLAKTPEDRYPDMAALEAELCELQIAAGLRTDWDDLPLPKLPEEQRSALSLRMPQPARRGSSGRHVGSRARWLGVACVGLVSVLAGFAYGADEPDEPREPASVAAAAVVDDSQVDRMVAAAREAASRAYWAYPPAGAPETPTALSWIEALEEQAGPLELMASLRAAELRAEFVETLVRLGDRYWQDPNGRPFASEYYTQALLFDASQPRARERVALTRTQLAELGARLLRGDYTELDLQIGGVLRALAEPREERRRAQVEALLVDGGLCSMRLESALVELTGARSAELDEARASEAEAELEAEADAEVQARARAEDEEDEEEQASRHDRSEARKLAERGHHALRWGRRDRARALFNRALKHDPELAEAHAGLAQLHFDRGDYGRAMRAARKAALGAPRDADLQLLLGDARLKSARYEGARRAYERAGRLGHRKAKRRIDELERLLR